MFGKLALAALTGAVMLAATSVEAQYYDPYDRAPRYDDYDRPRYGYDRPRYGYDRSYGRQRFGDTCVTSRGSCDTAPAPRNAPCRCYIEGFGPKRGNIY